MSHNSKVGLDALLVDARRLGGIVVDLPPGTMQGMRTEQKGFEDVVNEILTNHRTIGDRAGVTRGDVERLVTLNGQIADIDQYLPAARKLVELLTETRAVVDDERQRLVSAAAVSVDARAKASRDSSLLAIYQKTRDYRSAVGVKAAKTRVKNAAAAEAQEAMITEAVEKALANQSLQTDE